MRSLEGVKIGFAMCGSFCTFSKAKEQAEYLVSSGAEVFPIMSFNASALDTRFGKAADHIRHLEETTGHTVIKTICAAEPIGPNRMFDVLVVCPCTGNTLAKLACGITDTPVTMAVKSHIRNSRPVVIALATNDALAASAKNIGILLNRREYYFVPFGQDDCAKKPRSETADFAELSDTVLNALDGIQFQPLIL